MLIGGGGSTTLAVRGVTEGGSGDAGGIGEIGGGVGIGADALDASGLPHTSQNLLLRTSSCP